MTKIFPVQKVSKVAVTNNCVVISKGRVLQDCCVTEVCYKKYRQPKFLLKYFWPIFTSAKKSYILATDEWSKNYCHWLWEALTKVVELKKSVAHPTLILPESYLQIDFVVKSLAAFGFNETNIKLIPKKSHLRLKNLAFIRCINIDVAGYYDFLRFDEVADSVTSYYHDSLQKNFGNKIYISRSDPKKNTARKVANESELTEMLTKHGFKTVYMEDFSFLDQVSIMSHADFVVAPHGAGITNVMFAKKNCHLVEMLNKDWAKTCFAEMCDRMTIKYHRFDCESLNNGGGIRLDDITVDVKNLENELTKIL